MRFTIYLASMIKFGGLSSPYITLYVSLLHPLLGLLDNGIVLVVVDQLEETVAHDCYVIVAAAIVIVGNQ